MGGNMGTFLKKNWFIALVICIFTFISIYVIYDTNKGKLKGKTEGGEDVIYSVGDENVTSSQFYDELFESGGSDTVLTLFQKAVADASVETTDEMKEIASQQAESIISSYRSNYGSDYEKHLNADLASIGSPDLESYLITSQKISSLIGDYAKAHFDELKIRQISYILIQFEDPANASETPTADEQARMDAVDAAFAEGKEFAEVSAQFSEDSSTASNGGVLGVIDANTTSLDNAFLTKSLELAEGEISDWVYSSSFGYFRIMCTAATPETLEANNTDTDPYTSLINSYDNTLGNKAVWEKAQEIGIDYNGNEEIEKLITSAFAEKETEGE